MTEPPHDRGRVHRVLHAHPAVSAVTKAVVAVVGALVVAAGLVMLVTPGPAIVVIPLGLAILATEFGFARRWLEGARRWSHEQRARAAALDPQVRRRRVLAAAVVLVLLVGALAAYVAAYDWPSWSVHGWDYLQRLAAWVPELPGM